MKRKKALAPVRIQGSCLGLTANSLYVEYSGRWYDSDMYEYMHDEYILTKTNVDRSHINDTISTDRRPLLERTPKMLLRKM